jgi:pectinesterase
LIGEGAPAYLGRPWRWDRGSRAAVAFIRCNMEPHIRPEGWTPWDLKDKKNTDPASVTRYYEFGTRDMDDQPMDVSQRVPWSHQLSADDAKQYTVENILKGTDNWNPKAK